MSITLTVSLLETILPPAGSEERIELDNILRLPLRGEPKHFNVYYLQNMRLAKLCLTLAKETAEAIEQAQYKKFDALVKNFGCQITALEVQRKMQNRGALLQEAAEIIELAAKRLKNCLNIKHQGVCGMDVVTYLREAKLDIQISTSMAELVRLRMLCIVNSNKLKPIKLDNGKEVLEEVPFTNLSLLTKKVKNIEGLHRVERVVNRTQVEESHRSALFIQEVASNLPGERAVILKRLLGRAFLREAPSNRILSLPLLYNTEASIRGLNGIVLVKNKLKLPRQVH